MPSGTSSRPLRPKRYLDALLRRELDEVLVRAVEHSHNRLSRAFFCTASKADYVVKLGRPSALSLYSSEKWCLDRLAEADISAPACLLCGVWRGRAFLIQRRLNTSFKTATPDHEQCWIGVGSLVRRVTNIPVEGFGAPLREPLPDWQEYLQQTLPLILNPSVIRSSGPIATRDLD